MFLAPLTILPFDERAAWAYGDLRAELERRGTPIGSLDTMITTQRYGAKNFYWAVQWDEGNEFGFYRYGNAPIKEGSVCLINNYGHPHWVINNSNTDRLVLSVGADLNKIKPDIIRSWDLMHSLGRGNNP
jgi:hypothetical protein